MPDDMSKYLLMIIEDYDGRNTDKIKKDTIRRFIILQ